MTQRTLGGTMPTGACGVGGAQRSAGNPFPPHTITITITILQYPATSPRNQPVRPTLCRNIRTLHNFAPPATAAEVRASALQFVRKLSGYTKPSKANEEVFARAVDEVAAAAQRMLADLVTTSPPRNREVEAAKAKARAAKRYA